MEEFDNKAVANAADNRAQVKASTMVQESKARQRNAWGGGSTVRKQLEVPVLSANILGLWSWAKGPWLSYDLLCPVWPG